MAYRALTQVLLGAAPPLEPGDLVPDTFPNQFGEPEPVDFERLEELGAAEKVEDPKPSRAKAKHSEPDGE